MVGFGEVEELLQERRLLLFERSASPVGTPLFRLPYYSQA